LSLEVLKEKVVKELVEENGIVVEEVTADRREAVKKLDAKARNIVGTKVRSVFR